MNLLTKPNKVNFRLESDTMRWIERDMEGRVSGVYLDDPQPGYILALDPFKGAPTFQLKPILEIHESTDTKVHFTTEDEEYVLYLPKHFSNIFNKIQERINKNKDESI